MFPGLTYMYIYKIHTIDEFYFNNFSQVLDKEVIRCHTKIKNLEFGNENLEKELNTTVEKLLPLQAQLSFLIWKMPLKVFFYGELFYNG